MMSPNRPPLATATTLAAAVAIAFVLVGCASPLERRISRYPAEWQRLPETEKVQAVSGRVAEGMSRDGVFFAWGPPHSVAQGSQSGTAQESWRYQSYEPQFVYHNHIGFGYGYGYCPTGYGYYDFGPEVFYVPREAASVTFRNGRVVGWERIY